MRSVFFFSLFVLLAPGFSPAQTPTGTGAVKGIVRDPYGEGLPGVDVALTNEAMGVRIVMETTIDGLFEAPALSPASGYQLKVTRKGFASWESGELQVLVGQSLNFEIVLEEAKTAEREGRATVSMRTDGIATGPSLVVTEQQINNLPVPGRRLEWLVLLAPTAAWDPRSGKTTFRGQPLSSRTFLDGVAASSNQRAAPGVSQDAEEGIEVLSGGYAAELGGTMGAVVNVATRSGSNAYHGTLYDYFHNSSLTALPRYALGHNLAGTGHQAGASFGGPITKDKLFLFSNFEVTRADSKVLNRITSPLVTDSAGASVATSNCNASAAQCAAASQFIQGQMNVLAPRSMSSYAGIAKIDYRLSESSGFRFEVGETHQHWPEGEMTEAVAANGGTLWTDSAGGLRL